MITKFRLFESPDTTLYKNQRIRYDMYGAHPIGYLKDIRYTSPDKTGRNLINLNTGFVIGYEYGIHPNVMSYFGIEEKGIPALENFDYAGRIWKDKKLISFWQYPETKGKLDEIVKEINNLATDFQIDENEWEIEIYLDEIDPKDKWSDYSGKRTKFIKLKDYKTSNDPSATEYELHLLNAKDKAKALKDLGYKPKPIKTPKGMTQAQWRNKSTRFRFTESFQNFG